MKICGHLLSFLQGSILLSKTWFCPALERHISPTDPVGQVGFLLAQENQQPMGNGASFPPCKAAHTALSWETDWPSRGCSHKESLGTSTGDETNSYILQNENKACFIKCILWSKHNRQMWLLLFLFCGVKTLGCCLSVWSIWHLSALRHVFALWRSWHEVLHLFLSFWSLLKTWKCVWDSTWKSWGTVNPSFPENYLLCTSLGRERSHSDWKPLLNGCKTWEGDWQLAYRIEMTAQARHRTSEDCMLII